MTGWAYLIVANTLSSLPEPSSASGPLKGFRNGGIVGGFARPRGRTEQGRVKLIAELMVLRCAQPPHDGKEIAVIIGPYPSARLGLKTMPIAIDKTWGQFRLIPGHHDPI